MACVKAEKIVLHKNGGGLGFTIQGGIEVHYVANDTGIFVTSVKPNGAAARDGRLKEGDKILQIDGNDLRSVLHKQAVDLFYMSGDSVELVVERGAKNRIENSSSSIITNDFNHLESELPLRINRGRRKYYIVVPAVTMLLLGLPLCYLMFRFRLLRLRTIRFH